MGAPKLTPQEPGAPLPDANAETTSEQASGDAVQDAAPDPASPTPPEGETSTEGMASAAAPAPPMPIDPNLRAPDVEIERNAKMAALQVLNPDPPGLRDVSEYDADKLERPVLTKQGWLLPTNPGPKPSA